MKKPCRTISWDRIRFKANEDDYRPVTVPALGPYWCSGFGDGYSIVVAFVPHQTTDKQIKRFWPEAEEINRMQTDVPLEWSNRFPKPDWYKTP